MSIASLQREIHDLINNPIEGATVECLSGRIDCIFVALDPPDGYPFPDEEEFNLTISIQGNYPNEAPKAFFNPPIFHPNVNQYGVICHEAIKGNWNKCKTLKCLILQIQALLCDPNYGSPYNSEANEAWKKKLGKT
jgi:ubiquitin-protein ligase